MRNKFDERLAALGDDDALAGAGDFVNERKAFGLELGGFDRFGHCCGSSYMTMVMTMVI
jgi:hypothetical protein